MTNIAQFRSRLLHACMALGVMIALGLPGCGGGVGTGGSGFTGAVDGTVSGFGSVIIDGTEYDDSSASVQQDDGAGGLKNAEIKIGQRVRLVLASASSAQTVRVMPQLVGPVTKAQDVDGNFQVLAQRVRLAGSNADTSGSANAAVSNFAGGSVSAGDEVEVHGSWVYDGNVSSYVLVVSRVERLAASADPVQLAGVVQSIAGNSFRLNAADGPNVVASSLPPGLAAGSLVRIWATRNAWLASTSSSATALQASRVVDESLSASNLADQQLRLSGPVSRYDAATRTVEIQGTRVSLPGSLPVDQSSLAAGQFLSMNVARSGTSLVASSATQRSSAGLGSNLGQSIALKGVLSGVDWRAASVGFTLRGVSVAVAPALVPASCSQAVASASLLIEVTGLIASGSDLVTATSIQCTDVSSLLASTSGGSGMPVMTVDRIGTVTQLNLSARTLVLQTMLGDVAVQWDAQTFFPTEFLQYPDRMSNQRVAVEGTVQTGILHARKIQKSI